MNNEIDYEAMEREYSKIKPVTLQGSPFSNENTPNQTAIKPLARLYCIYSSIDTVLDKIASTSGQKDIVYLAQNLSKNILNNVITLLNLDCLPEKEQIPNLSGYSNAVRFLLKKSIEGCCSALTYKQQIPYLTFRLCYEDIQALHLVLMTLTAF